MRAPLRGGPGAFGARAARAAELAGPGPAAEPLAFLAGVLEHQLARSDATDVIEAAADAGGELTARRLGGSAPWLRLEASAPTIAAETLRAVEALGSRAATPGSLRDAGDLLRNEPDGLVRDWLDDPTLVDPRIAVWIRIGAGPILERAAGNARLPSREEWAGAACPLCGDLPQCSAIVEESDALLQGAPRYLICGRCASWWPFPRATCPSCGEDDSRRVGPFVSDLWPWARMDACDTCHAYVKTFDLRIEGAKDVVPLVDDVGTPALDVWASDAGLHRPILSFAGV
jgi:formate dehydrogenase maturation protein FdhE